MKLRIWYTLKGELNREIINVDDLSDVIEQLKRFEKMDEVHVIEAHMYTEV